MPHFLPLHLEAVVADPGRLPHMDAGDQRGEEKGGGGKDWQADEGGGKRSIQMIFQGLNWLLMKVATKRAAAVRTGE